MTDYVRIGPKLDPRSASQLSCWGKSLNAAATFACEAWPRLIVRALEEIRGVFEERELRLILDVLGGTTIDPRSVGRHIPIGISDAMTTDAIDRKWEVDGPELIRKINSLTTFQRAAIEIWCLKLRENDDVLEREIEKYAARR